MIQWLREKFEELVQVFVVLTIIIAGIAGGICGTMLTRGSVGFFLLGAAIACLLAFVYCIVVYGLIATVVCIANSTEASTSVLNEIKSKLSDLAAIKNKLNELDDISAKLSSVRQSDNFYTVQRDGKMFAVNDTEAGKYFCPKCHAEVVETDFSCSNCNASLVVN